ncbi:hypothetical protein HN954_02210 [bacterium]|jgi:hypothetical protein|nr:hypothetical protein [bacterium]MBT6832285.1 hypothetical protein [bacterium]MBT6996222.1 hypothetical protein [bacterium]MBT7772469.1 hypothetical protein [bacterium]
MKKWLFTGILFLFVGGAHAQGFEFETIRTPETPGFFLVEIFADRQSDPIPMHDVFVKNFSKKNATKYDELLIALPDFGAQVIECDELKNFENVPDTRLVILGKKIDDFPTFEAENSADIFADFEIFAQENLPVIFLQNLEATFGGNVSDIFVEKNELLGDGSVTIVGKFERPMKTRMELRGVTATGEITMVAPIPLHDEIFSIDPIAHELPQIWEEFWQKNQPQKSTPIWLRSNFIFPLLVGLIGLVVMIAIFRSMRKKYRNFQEQVFSDEIPLRATKNTELDENNFSAPPHLE